MEQKTSIIKEAITDYKKIVEIAENSARKKIAMEFPNKFNELLNQEISSKLDNNINEDTNKIVEMKEDKSKKKNLKESENMLPDTETITVNEIEDEIFTNDEVPSDEEPEAEAPVETEEDDDDINSEIMDVLVDLKNSIDQLINGSSDDVAPEEKPVGDVATDDVDAKLDDIVNDIDTEEKVDETEEFDLDFDLEELDEEESEISDEEIEAALSDLEASAGAEEVSDEELEEGRGVSHSARRTTSGRSIPNYDYLSGAEKDQAPFAIRESRMKKLVSENKTLTKKVNELNKKLKEDRNLFENYKTALEKYRNLLNEMAIFNTNLSHVNGLFINENISLTQDEKVNIINEFKKVKSINESKEKYNSVLKEMVSKKPLMNESIENIVKDNAIQPSAPKQNLVETTVYDDNKHLQRIKGVSKYIEQYKR